MHFNPTELIMKFAIFGNTYQAKKSSHAENLFRLLGQHNAQLCICREFHHFLTTDLHLNIPDAELFDGDDFCADMVISIGGDGTFLKEVFDQCVPCSSGRGSHGIFLCHVEQPECRRQQQNDEFWKEPRQAFAGRWKGHA